MVDFVLKLLYSYIVLKVRMLNWQNLWPLLDDNGTISSFPLQTIPIRILGGNEDVSSLFVEM
jgi:hypothetical protein